MRINRRQFSAGLLAAAGVVGMPGVLRAQAKPRVVVIGGGPGGATVAKYVARDSQGAVEVTMIEPLETFVTCFHSNLYLGDMRSFESICHGYKLGSYGVKHVRQFAAAIDRDKKEVKLADGSAVPYDRLVMAPGIDIKFDSVPGYSEAAAEIMPHGWKPGAQTKLVKKQLDALQDGATIVMVAPPNPYRCPPGPYERVSVMAKVLKAKGHTRSKIIVLDPKDKFSKMALFQECWQKHYPGMVEWMDPKMHGGIKGVDPQAMTVTTDFETIKADMVNVIPAQMAGKIAREAGLVNETGYCPIDATNMKSAIDPNIYVLGDASIAGAMPKSAFAANSQAKVVANAVRGELTGSRTFPARYANTCWSVVAQDDTVKIGGRYEPKDGKIAEIEGFVSKTGEDAGIRLQTSEENMGWYAGITADIFS
ncbi:Sulfide dehydrogenase [flavocytochrome c] flavoprotein chain [Rhodopseudomonas palustris]|uniref:FCSD flavin-binding domain-containing protein n=1 Tax=Rhodopseudomonas palustris (strain ATCC BAA-98 / CGA009) TaxID=258594 RepID=Q6N1E6_RHOPA|nr:NAD(P)/FAD-dependent oxidoreductase [Rhodopseudomonas palustris]OPF96045.1 flavocytochrome C [Rhodopseudomonas palustris]QQM06031.1 Sulfide dehydrogenase [flavocytochrome c] flavoprotein chain [Rhodopseudomonas palustris]RJF66631.1 NAD(P)/FAD-dependent oxidoreductase [Rhodopseudomonas palustris]WAB77353.1 FCSD flavin-binding domain-containing protein [Rhodopseudomonas palustris]WCL94661.1 FCSD flavin-binding domain-containing protein [Rhodopseudomonas palustris CGA009]